MAASFTPEALCPLCHSVTVAVSVDGGQGLLTLCKAVACGPSIVSSEARAVLADRYSHVNIGLQQQAAQAGPAHILRVHHGEAGLRAERVAVELVK